ncbi:MAG: hypothetical protein JSR37_08330 [Verrucomicrobia bacterium]|nr:hypothetical protein [Verrucomicrobiota bacterium]MBS0636274.1 hypothetical protein [Verrucomicrobiota bacterium]
MSMFIPGSAALQAMWQGIEASVVTATESQAIASVQISAKFNTPKKVDKVCEEFGFFYGFPQAENGYAKVMLNHAQDPDGPSVTREEIEERKEPEQQLLNQLGDELKREAGCVARIACVYKFFMDVSIKVLHATHLRNIDVIVNDSKGLYHHVSFGGNFPLK